MGDRDNDATREQLLARVARQRAWDEEEKRFFRRLGKELRDLLTSCEWSSFQLDERRACVEAARDHLHAGLGIKRPAPIVWIDDPNDKGAGYDEQSAEGDIHYPEHHLETASPSAIVRGLCEEMRHAWQDDVRRGLREHPLGELGRRAVIEAFERYDLTSPINDSTNVLELDAKERAEWCVDGYVGNPD